jgi:serine/threonine protein kinase
VPAVTNLPERIGRYRIERLLGRGAMGLVCRAHDPDIDRPVAIKLILADLLASEDRDAYLARFRREAQAAGRCMHPNIVAVHDVSVHEGNPFIVLEYVDGISLREALDQGTRFTPGVAVALMLQVLEALSCAHALGIIHQDIKPANILLLREGQVKVADFGIARLRGDAAEDGTVLGTPSYMSPEQCQGKPLDHRTDLFSIGAVLYELLSGRRAFPGRSYTEIAHRLTQAVPPRLHDAAPGIPAALCTVVDRALARDPAARFPDASAMAAALRAAPLAPPEDATVVLVPSRASQPGPGPILGADTIGTIERRLAQELGPIAKLLVSSAARTAPSLEALCQTLSRNIPSQAARDRFMAEALAGTGRGGGVATQARATLAGSSLGGSASMASSLGEHDIERARQELARYLGPIAKVLVRRESAAARSVPALWERLAAHIERPADRTAFLSRRPQG